MDFVVLSKSTGFGGMVVVRRKTKDRLPFHNDIARWRAEGRSLGEISQLIREHHGADLNRHVVNRYCAYHGIVLSEEGPEPANPQQLSPVPGVPPVAAEPAPAPAESLSAQVAPVVPSPAPALSLTAAAKSTPDASRPAEVPAAPPPEAPPGPTLATDLFGPEVAPQAPGEASPDPMAGMSSHAVGRIGRLKALWDEGVLTEGEFRVAAERLLGLTSRIPDESPDAEPMLPESPSPQSSPEPEAVPPEGEPRSQSAEATPAAAEVPSGPKAIPTPDLGEPSPAVEQPSMLPPEPPLASPPVPALALLTSAEAFPTAAPRWRPPSPPFPPQPRPPVWTPDLPVLSFPQQGDAWTLRDAWEGTFILGATGSGKTSGSGQTLACSFLHLGFGGLVLCVKPDERQLWEKYAEATGRSGQLCVVESGGPFRFNFLDYEAQRCRPSLDWVENITHLFAELMAVFARGQGDRQPGSFWIHAGNQLLRNTLRVLARSRHGLQLAEIGALVAEAPASLAEVKQGTWRETPHFGAFMQEAQRLDSVSPDMQQAQRYWLSEFPKLPDKTRATLVTALSAMVDVLYSSDIYDLFCRGTTLTPEAVQEGAIIVVDLPLKTRDFTGLLTQCIWKYFFQKAIERRAEPSDACRRPVFLWIDEAQFFYTNYDSLFQSTARSSGCATVYLTQNIANFYGLYGGDRNRIDGFLGNLNTKIFHANNDHASNIWAAEQIGKAMQYRASISMRDPQPPRSWQEALLSLGRSGGGGVNVNPQMDYEVQPGDFAKLRTGGAHNHGQVDAYFAKSGARFFSGKHYMKTTFQQEV